MWLLSEVTLILTLAPGSIRLARLTAVLSGGGGAGAGAAAIPRGPGGRQEGDAGGQHQDQAQSRHQTRVREDGPVRPQAWSKKTQMKHLYVDTIIFSFAG